MKEPRQGQDTTFWMGSSGAGTRLHYDTYGTNFVAQLYGRKRWRLFSPSAQIEGTRIPYEESSVFSTRTAQQLLEEHDATLEVSEGYL